MDAGWSFNAKWPSEIGEMGFTMVPRALLEYYQELELKPSEFLVLVNIESYRWNANKLPFPSVETLSERTGISERSITRIITALEKERGVIRRQKRRRTSNEYSFDPLITKLLNLLRADSRQQFSSHIRHTETDIFMRYDPS